jgi:hypothetical protein
MIARNELLSSLKKGVHGPTATITLRRLWTRRCVFWTMRVKAFGVCGPVGFRVPGNPKPDMTPKGIDLIWGM